MMICARDAVDALDQIGRIEFTYDTNGNAVYGGLVVRIGDVLNEAKTRKIAIAYHRTIIDNGTCRYVISK